MLKFNITHPTTARTIKVNVHTNEHNTAKRFLDCWSMPLYWLLNSEEQVAMDRIKVGYVYYSAECFYLKGTISPEGDYQSEYKDDPTLHPLAKIEVPDTGETVYCYHYDIIAVHPNGKPEQAKIARID
jgi:hypothetical protein